MGTCMSRSSSSSSSSSRTHDPNSKTAKVMREPPTRNGSISVSQPQKPRRSIAPDTIVLIENEKPQDITVGEAHAKEKDEDDNPPAIPHPHHRRKSTHSEPRYFVFHVPSTTRSRLSQSSQISNPTSNQTSPETETQVVIHHQQ